MLDMGTKDDRPDRLRQRQGHDPAFPRLLGGRFCLDFANTVESPHAEPHDYLTGYAALGRWARHAGLLTNEQAARLIAAGERRPDAAEAAFRQGLALRAAIQGAFTRIVAGEDPAPGDLATIQAMDVAGLTRARLTARDDGFVWMWDDEAMRDDLERPFWEVARSAIELLTAGELARVKTCAGPEGCGWLFYDTSRNGSRRWCSMEGCGSRAKMRRYTARRRQARS